MFWVRQQLINYLLLSRMLDESQELVESRSPSIMGSIENHFDMRDTVLDSLIIILMFSKTLNNARGVIQNSF